MRKILYDWTNMILCRSIHMSRPVCHKKKPFIWNIILKWVIFCYYPYPLQSFGTSSRRPTLWYGMGTSLTLSPVLADAWKYSYPLFLMKVCISDWSTSLVCLCDTYTRCFRSALLPITNTTACLRSRSFSIMIFSHLDMFWKLYLLSKSNTSRTPWASLKNTLRISL